MTKAEGICRIIAVILNGAGDVTRDVLPIAAEVKAADQKNVGAPLRIRDCREENSCGKN